MFINLDQIKGLELGTDAQLENTETNLMWIDAVNACKIVLTKEKKLFVVSIYFGSDLFFNGKFKNVKDAYKFAEEINCCPVSGDVLDKFLSVVK